MADLDKRAVEAFRVAWLEHMSDYTGLDKAITAALIAYEAARPVSAGEAEGWMPIETAPKDGDEIDLWANGERLTDCWWGRPTYGGRERTWVRHAYDDSNGPVFASISNASHWRPLPPPPSDMLSAAGGEG